MKLVGDQEDASKQGRKIDDIDKDVEITLVDETQGRYGDDIMFDVSDLAGEKKNELVEGSSKKVDAEIAQKSSSKRAGDELEQESIKKQKVDKDKETAELKSLMYKAKYGSKDQGKDLDLVLYGDLRQCLTHMLKIKYGKQLDYRVLEWKLYDSCGVHSLRKQNVHIYMLVEKRYPLTTPTITYMLNKKLKADHWNEMCYQLLKLITKQLKNQ
ncbi:hypothetical protein Tco_1295735 [Tanacetum coccineum]